MVTCKCFFCDLIVSSHVALTCVLLHMQMLHVHHICQKRTGFYFSCRGQQSTRLWRVYQQNNKNKHHVCRQYRNNKDCLQQTKSLSMFESLAAFLRELLHILKRRGQSESMPLEHPLKRRKRWNRWRAAAVVSTLTAAAPNRSTKQWRLVGQNCDRYIFVAGKFSGGLSMFNLLRGETANRCSTY